MNDKAVEAGAAAYWEFERDTFDPDYKSFYNTPDDDDGSKDYYRKSARIIIQAYLSTLPPAPVTQDTTVFRVVEKFQVLARILAGKKVDQRGGDDWDMVVAYLKSGDLKCAITAADISAILKVALRAKAQTLPPAPVDEVMKEIEDFIIDRSQKPNDSYAKQLLTRIRSLTKQHHEQ